MLLLESKSVRIGLPLIVLLLLVGGCDAPTDNSSRKSLHDVKDVTVYDTPPGWDFSVADNGDIWTNNESGVASYDYTTDRWTQYNADDIAAIKEATQGSIHVDGNDIWVTYGWAGDEEIGIGVTRWNHTNDDHSHYLYPDTTGFPRGPVWHVTEDGNGDIWVGTRYGAGSARFDGTTWTPVYIEELGAEDGDRYFDCNTVEHDGVGNAYFSTWRGGLHILSDTGEWIHTEKGAANGTESFLLRGLYSGDIAFTDDGSTVYAATRDWTGNDSVEPADGVWKYENGTWTNLADGIGEAYGAILDDRGYLWSTFTADYRLRYFDGTSWIIMDLDGYGPSAADYIAPALVDGDYLWLTRHVTDKDSQIVRIKYR